MSFAEALLAQVAETDVDAVVDRYVAGAEVRKQVSQLTQSTPPLWTTLVGLLDEYNKARKRNEGSLESDPVRFAPSGSHLSGDLARIYQKAGLNNNLQAPRSVDNRGMGTFVKALLSKLASVDDSFGKLGQLDFADKKGVLNEVLLAGWPKDLYTVYLAFQALPKEKQVQAHDLF